MGEREDIQKKDNRMMREEIRPLQKIKLVLLMKKHTIPCFNVGLPVLV